MVGIALTAAYVALIQSALVGRGTLRAITFPRLVTLAVSLARRRSPVAFAGPVTLAGAIALSWLIAFAVGRSPVVASAGLISAAFGFLVEVAKKAVEVVAAFTRPLATRIAVTFARPVPLAGPISLARTVAFTRAIAFTVTAWRGRSTEVTIAAFPFPAALAGAVTFTWAIAFTVATGRGRSAEISVATLTVTLALAGAVAFSRTITFAATFVRLAEDRSQFLDLSLHTLDAFDQHALAFAAFTVALPKVAGLVESWIVEIGRPRVASFTFASIPFRSSAIILTVTAEGVTFATLAVTALTIIPNWRTLTTLVAVLAHGLPHATLDLLLELLGVAVPALLVQHGHDGHHRGAKQVG